MRYPVKSKKRKRAKQKRLKCTASSGSIWRFPLLSGGWGIPIASHTLNVTVGSIVKRPVTVNGTIEKVEQLCLTVSFDHDIVDGAPAARFIRELTKLIRSGKEILA